MLDNNLDQLIRINQSFKPTRPIDHLSSLAGRQEQIRRIVNVITQPGAHALVYGERGVGKTSLVSILGDIFERAKSSYAFVRINCDKEQSFPDLWHRVLREIKITYGTPDIGFQSLSREIILSADVLLSSDRVNPDDIRQLFSRFSVHPVIIIDEIDRMKSGSAFGLLADTVKTLSDHATNTTLILVGVASDVNELIGEHPSVERALTQIQVPRMKPEELQQALKLCLNEAEMIMEDEAQDYIVLLSKGFPHYTHLLGLHAARIANQSNRKRIVMRDIDGAIQSAGNDVQQTIRLAYVRAIETSQAETLHKTVLLGCALAEPNELGYFSARDVKEEISELTGRQIEVSTFARYLTDFSTLKRGNILERVGQERQYRYRFTNPLMQPYVLIRGVEQEILNFDRLERLKR